KGNGYYERGHSVVRLVTVAGFVVENQVTFAEPASNPPPDVSAQGTLGLRRQHLINRDQTANASHPIVPGRVANRTNGQPRFRQLCRAVIPATATDRVSAKPFLDRDSKEGIARDRVEPAIGVRSSDLIERGLLDGQVLEGQLSNHTEHWGDVISAAYREVST